MKDYNSSEKLRSPQRSLEGTAIKAKIMFEATGRCCTAGDTDTQKGKLSFADQIAFHQKNPQPLYESFVVDAFTCISHLLPTRFPFQFNKYTTHPKCKHLIVFPL